MVLVPHLAIGKLRNVGISLTVNTIVPLTSAGKAVFAQFTKVRSIHRRFSSKPMDDNQKCLFCNWQLVINTEFFHRAFANPCRM
jgi:hypothetical protein